MIRVIVFDFDGTLVDSNAVKKHCMHRIASRLPGGGEAMPAVIAEGGDRYVLFARLVDKLERGADPGSRRALVNEMTAAYSECCARAIAAVPERRGAKATLAELRRRGFRLWVASATPARDLPPLLRRRGLDRYLDGALGGPASKAENLWHIAQSERVPTRQMLMIGDGPDDLAGARKVGAHFLAITAENRIAEPQRFAMRDLTKLLPLIDRLSPRPSRRGTGAR